MTIESNRITAILGDGHHWLQDRRTHTERLNYWDEFQNPAHIPGIGIGYADAIRRLAEEVKDANDSGEPRQQGVGRNRVADPDRKPNRR